MVSEARRSCRSRTDLTIAARVAGRQWQRKKGALGDGFGPSAVPRPPAITQSSVAVTGGPATDLHPPRDLRPAALGARTPSRGATGGRQGTRHTPGPWGPAVRRRRAPVAMHSSPRRPRRPGLQPAETASRDGRIVGAVQRGARPLRRWQTLGLRQTARARTGRRVGTRPGCGRGGHIVKAQRAQPVLWKRRSLGGPRNGCLSKPVSLPTRDYRNYSGSAVSPESSSASLRSGSGYRAFTRAGYATVPLLRGEYLIREPAPGLTGDDQGFGDAIGRRQRMLGTHTESGATRPPNQQASTLLIILDEVVQNCATFFAL